MRKTITFLGIALAVLLLCIPVFAGNPWTGSAVITVATDNDLSAAVTLPQNVRKISLKVPTLDSAAVKLQVSADGTNYGPLYCFNNGTNTIEWSTAALTTAGPVVEVPCDFGGYTHLKVATGAGQTSNRTFTIIGWRDAEKP